MDSPGVQCRSRTFSEAGFLEPEVVVVAAAAVVVGAGEMVSGTRGEAGQEVCTL